MQIWHTEVFKGNIGLFNFISEQFFNGLNLQHWVVCQPSLKYIHSPPPSPSMTIKSYGRESSTVLLQLGPGTLLVPEV
jgi:hypothetical protein